MTSPYTDRVNNNMGWLTNARLSPFRLTTLVGDQATELEGTKSALNLVLQSAGYVMKFVENGRQRQKEPSSIFASLSEDAKETTVIVKKSFKRQAWGDK